MSYAAVCYPCWMRKHQQCRGDLDVPPCECEHRKPPPPLPTGMRGFIADRRGIAAAARSIARHAQKPPLHALSD